MNARLKKYDYSAYKIVTVPIWELNEIFDKAGTDLRVIPRGDSVRSHYEAYKMRTDNGKIINNIDTYKDKHFFKEIDCSTGDTRPHIEIASEILEIDIKSWKWAKDDYAVEIIYAIKES